jgi:ubiquinone/menaquinone biosynthesis C-methylase UbiE
MTTDDGAANAEQIAFWNGPGGSRWLAHQARQDLVLAPVSGALFERVPIAAGERVVDVGCGCGPTTIELGRRVGAGGHVLGVDVSALLLGRARELAPPGPPIEFALADATVHRFDPGLADLLFSRFGVMFFTEPARSFANLRRALRPQGRLAFACWREPRANPWLMLPLQVVTKHVPRLPELGPEDPGPFSFAAEARVRRILGDAGFAAIALEPVDLMLDLASGGGLEAAIETATRVGPASRALEGQPEALVTVALQSLREALAPHVVGGRVALPAAIWIVTAHNLVTAHKPTGTA